MIELRSISSTSSLKDVHETIIACTGVLLHVSLLLMMASFRVSMLRPLQPLPVLLLLCFNPLMQVNGDVFASIVDLTNTLHAEQSVIEAIRQYVTTEAQRLKDITDMITAMEEKNTEALLEPDRNLADISVGFQTIDRFTNQWWEQKDRVLSTRNRDNLENRLNGITKNYPNERDLKRAADSIFRLQDVYQFNVESFANGSITQQGNVMKAYDCCRVAEEAFKLWDLYHAMLWYEEALRLSIQTEDDSIERDKIYEHLIVAYYSTGKLENLPRIIELAKEWLAYNRVNDLARKAIKFYSQRLQSAIVQRQLDQCSPDDGQCKRKIRAEMEHHPAVIEKIRTEWENEPDYLRFESLCRGENVYNSHRLYCRYKTDNPLFTITPVKEEVLRIDPYIAIFHDFLSDKEVDTLKTLATPHLERSMTFATQDLEDKDTHVRTSKTAWIPDSADPLVARVTERSVALGNLSTLSVDEMQVVCYGLGGHYGPHFDWGEEEHFHDHLGNRIATVVHYLSDFTGGSTAFMNADVKVPPKKGTTLFWWNLKRNLEGDTRNLHAGCPVIYGNKWIANKWIHVKAQWPNRPCLLDKDA